MPPAQLPEMSAFLPFADQGMYLAHVAGGQHAVIQLLWRYLRPVDHAALMRFRDTLAQGPLSRLIRPARLPFGRHQWVAAHMQPPPLDAGVAPLAPSELQAWADAQVDLPLDPTHGPPWTLSLQPFADGSTVVSLVVSHCIADGMATALAVSEAARGHCRTLGLPVAQASAAGMASEMWRCLGDAPATLKALAGLVRMARAPRPRHDRAAPAAAGKAADDRTVDFPTAFLRVSLADWDARARSLGANRFTLLAALTASFAVALGRVQNDEVTLLVPVNQREGLSDDGGNRVSLATVKLERTVATGRLHALQRRLQTELVRTRREPDPLAAVLPLVPFVPPRAFAATSRLALGALADLPVTCSHMGDLPKDITRIDGSEADRFCFRGIDRQAAVTTLEQRQGVATLLAGVIPGDMLLNFVAYQPGVLTQSHDLRHMARGLLADVGLTGAFFDD